MDKSKNSIIYGDALKKALEQYITSSEKEVVIISAYVTQKAVEWLAAKLKNKLINVTIICRLQPADILNNSTNISALSFALENGWKISCLHSLHAKIYSIDNEHIYVGSANLTSNGLRIYGKGNLEACIKIDNTKESIDFINKVILASTSIDSDVLNRIEIATKDNSFPPQIDKWPDGIILQNEGLWVRDMLWWKPSNAEAKGLNYIHDLEILGIKKIEKSPKSIEAIRKSRCIKWLADFLSTKKDKTSYFGELTKALHDELKDDPAPYRQDVKGLVQNLLTYCQIYLDGVFDVSKPNQSQVIRGIK